MELRDEELEKLLEKKARELMRKSKGGSGEVVVKRVGAGSRNGIYVYDRERGVWRLYRVEGGAFQLGELGDGVYVVYFGNTRCKACRSYDEYWHPFVETVGRELEGYHFVIVLCDWFTHRCSSPAASASFREHRVLASPTTLLAYVVGGKTVYQEKYEGVLTRDELEKVVPSFRERGERAQRGEKVESPLREKLARDDIVKLLEKMLGIRLM
ncbi:TlpA family protein disulfide reductase [Pyrodictium delaneyi]|uniref:TlpA family protein disulfide reductase n=1 Tax=Pyrodictium delaneyi TaxID=1273541 RepID=UPI00117A26F5|nr:hypothetical protein [Pyrodictium delaneyi]